MKKWISLSLLLTLFTALTTAHADMIWEPDNDFYWDYPGDFDNCYRYYLANGPTGSATLYDAPNGETIVAQEENGTRLWVNVIYEDWGCATDFEADERLTGWVPMAQLVKAYDFESFAEDYGDQFEPYGGEFDNYSGPIDGTAFWEYPGAAEPLFIWTLGEDLRDECRKPDCFSCTFTDENGYRWGYIQRMYIFEHFWICLDEPLKTDFPTRAIPDYNLIPAKKAWFPAKMRLPAFLVLAVVSVTAGLLCGLRYKKRRPDKASETWPGEDTT